MTDEPTNVVQAHLREFRTAMDAKFDAVDRRFDVIEQRMDRMETNSLKAIRSFVGHRSMVERTVADYDGDLADLKRRVRRLEDTTL